MAEREWTKWQVRPDARILDEPLLLVGEVVKGFGRGSKVLGIPTGAPIVLCLPRRIRVPQRLSSRDVCAGGAGRPCTALGGVRLTHKIFHGPDSETSGAGTEICRISRLVEGRAGQGLSVQVRACEMV